MQTESNSRKIVLITGAARRIGAAIARTLHAAGFDLVLHYRSSEQDMQALHDELEHVRTGSVLALQADLANPETPARLVDSALRHYGRLDALVNNASAFFESSLGSTTLDEWDALFAINARAPFLLCQAAAPALRESRGAIVNLTDLYAMRPRPDVLAYAATKAALESLTRGMASALGPGGVRVNAVAPGAILWPEEDEEGGERTAMLARTPLGRTGKAGEVAEAVRWLLMDAGFVTGQVLRVDGGRDAHWL